MRPLWLSEIFSCQTKRAVLPGRTALFVETKQFHGAGLSSTGQGRTISDARILQYDRRRPPRQRHNRRVGIA